MNMSMNMNMNMNSDQEQQSQGQVQARSQDQSQSQIQMQEQVSRLLSLLTPPGQLHGAWTKFLIEVLSVLEEAGLIKRVSPEYKKYDDKYQCIMRNLSRIRIVGPLFRNTQRLEYKVPFIRLSGLWLEKCGFFVGQRFLVYPKEDQLLLKKIYLCSDWLNKEEYETGKQETGNRK
jgi:hypothetical protein